MNFLRIYLEKFLFFFSLIFFNYIFIFLFILPLNILMIFKETFIFNPLNFLLISLLSFSIAINILNALKSLKLNYKASFLSGPWIFFLNFLISINEYALSLNSYSGYFYYSLSILIGFKSVLSSLNFRFHYNLDEITNYFNLKNSHFSLISKYQGQIYYTIYNKGFFYRLSSIGESKYFNSIEYKNKKYSYEKVLNYLNDNNKTINDLSLEDLKLLEIYLY